MPDVEEDLSALLSSASLVFVGGIVTSLSKLAERVIIGRALTPGIYGEINIALAVLTLSVTVSMVGLNQGVPRFLSRYDRTEQKRGVWMTGLVFAEAVALATAAILYLSAEQFAPLVLESHESVGVLKVFVLAIPLVVGFKVGMGGIRGLENTVYKTLIGDLLYPIGRILLLVVLLWLGFGAFAAGYAYVIAAGVVFLASHLLLNRLLPLVGPFKTYLREMLDFSAPLLISTVLATLLSRTDTVMLGYFRSSEAVGLYNAAYPLAGGLLVVLSSFGFLYLPLASRLDAADEHEEIGRIYEITTKWIYILTFPAFLLFVSFPADVLGLFFGHQYVPAAQTLVILAAGFFASAAAGRSRETVSALGRTKVLLVINAAVFGLNVVLNLLLIPHYGHVGAAFASAASNISLNTIVVLFLGREYGITPLSKRSIRTFVVLPVVFIPASLLVSNYVSMTALTLPAFLICSGLACVVVVCLIGALQPEDTIAVEFLEDLLHVRLWFIRRFIPSSRLS